MRSVGGRRLAALKARQTTRSPLARRGWRDPVEKKISLYESLGQRRIGPLEALTSTGRRWESWPRLQPGRAESRARAVFPCSVSKSPDKSLFLTC